VSAIDDTGTPTCVDCGNAAATGCPGGTTPIGPWCIDNFRRSVTGFTTATLTCHAEGRAICSVEALMICDVLNPTTSGCRIDTDTPSSRLWTSTFDAAFATRAFQGIAIYGGDEIVRPGDAGDFYPYYCCGVRAPAAGLQEGGTASSDGPQVFSLPVSE